MPRIAVGSILLGPGLAVCAALALSACGGAAPAAQSATPSGAATTSGADTAGANAAGSGKRVTIDGSEALEWGSGRYGVVLAHGAAFDAASWAPQAVRIAAQDSTVVAVEDISPKGILAAVDNLRGRGLTAVALVGGSAGADAILELASTQPGVPDQLVLISPNQPQDGLGAEPKLFIASAGEPLVDVARKLAASAAGKDNEVLILPGSAHAQNIFDTDQAEPLTQAVLTRLARFANR